MDKKESRLFPPVGVSSLLVIFAVLCLTVFALLSLSTARADARLQQQTAAAVTGWYEADCAAEEILARLRNGEVPEGVTEHDGVYTYGCPISATQTLAVAVQVEGSDYVILRWQAVSTVDWQAGDQLPVWQGN